MALSGRAWLLPALAFGLPLTAALVLALEHALDRAAWLALLNEPALAASLGLALWVGLASTLLALGVTLVIVTALFGRPAWQRMQRALGPALAVPHAAFAVGLALLLAPSGLPARLIAPLAGWDVTPDVATVQERFGLALIGGLVLKELPFLLWTAAALLQRVGQGAQIERQLQLGASLGYPRTSIWYRVLWPQLLPRLALPLLAVWAYALTGVEMALVLGPTRPPTLGVLAWQWLLEADAQRQRVGAAAALLLTAVMAVGAGSAALAWYALRPLWQRRAVRGDRPAPRGPGRAAERCVAGVAAVYAAVLALLAFASVAGVWTFPALWPQVVDVQAWRVVFGYSGALAPTAWLALASSASGVAVAVAWLESTPARWDRRAAPLVFAPMLVPGVLLAAGLYRVALALHLDGRFAGLWIAHTLYAAPYALVALAPAYRGFDDRLSHTVAALGRGRATFLWRIKWPMLRAPLGAALAVGFAVSVTQYLSTQFVGAGRWATVTTEALTLASGGQRPLMAAFALLQALLPALAFGVVWWIGQAQARRLGAA